MVSPLRRDEDGRMERKIPGSTPTGGYLGRLLVESPEKYTYVASSIPLEPADIMTSREVQRTHVCITMYHSG